MDVVFGGVATKSVYDPRLGKALTSSRFGAVGALARPPRALPDPPPRRFPLVDLGLFIFEKKSTVCCFFVSAFPFLLGSAPPFFAFVEIPLNKLSSSSSPAPFLIAFKVPMPSPSFATLF